MGVPGYKPDISEGFRGSMKEIACRRYVWQKIVNEYESIIK